MLKSIGLENFRAFKKLDNLEINPLTVLCGTNSSGKSTIIKSILLWKQSIDRDSTSGVRGFAYNGELVQLGSPKNWLFNNEKNKEIKFKLKISTKDGGIKPHLVRQILGQGTGHGTRDQDGRPLEYEINFSLGFIPFPNAEGGIKITDYHINIKKISFVKTNKSSPELASKKKSSRQILDIRIEGDSQNDNYTISWKNLPEDGRWSRVHGDELKKERKAGTIKVLNDSSLINILRFEPDFTNINIESTDHDILRQIFFISLDIKASFRDIFNRISYLGPIRGEPKRVIFDEGYSGNMGTKGENTEFIFDHYIKRRVAYYFFDSKENKFNSRKTTLRKASELWLSELGIKNFKLKKYANDILSFHLNSSEYSDYNVSIADVGFGVSQVVPIIIQGLLLGRGGTLMIEQPELHLHPKMQMKLADFFLSLVIAGKKIIVETHSEHIINRLVRRVVEDNNNKFKQLVGINFVSSTKNGSKIEKIELSETEGIVNWPDEFFDQAADEQEKIMTAIIQKK